MLFGELSYREFQPHKLFKDFAIEDIAIARFFKKQKQRIACLTGEKRIRCRMYRSYQEALCGPGHLLDKMKELWSYLGASFPGRKRQLEAIARSRTMAEYEGAAAALLGR